MGFIRQGEQIPTTQCCECNGRGYHTFDTDRGIRLQANDDCDCVWWRWGAAQWPPMDGDYAGTDDMARELFVHDLECGDWHAQQCARSLESARGEFPDPPPGRWSHVFSIAFTVHGSRTSDASDVTEAMVHNAIQRRLRELPAGEWEEAVQLEDSAEGEA